MSVLTKTEQINRSLEPKRVDQFYVTFLDIPENVSNILGRQVKSIQRPALSLKQSELMHKGKPRHDHAFIEFAETSITFWDDDQSLVIRSIYEQLYRQLGNGDYSREESFHNARFRVKTKVFSASGDVVEEFTMMKCFIASVQHSENIYNDSEQTNEITIDVRYDDVQYEFTHDDSLN